MGFVRFGKIVLTSTIPLVLIGGCSTNAPSQDGWQESRYGSTSLTSETSIGVLPVEKAPGCGESSIRSSKGLSDAITQAVPRDFTQLPSGEGSGTGAVGLATRAEEVSVDDGERALADAGFIRGYSRLWFDSERSTQIAVFVYQYDNIEGPLDFVDEIGEPPEPPTLQPVEGLPGVSTESVEVDGAPFVLARTTCGPFEVRLFMAGPQAEPAIVGAILRDQLRQFGSV